MRVINKVLMLLIALVLIIGATLFGMQHWQSRTDAQTTQSKAERHVTMVVKHDGKEKTFKVTLKKGETLLMQPLPPQPVWWFWNLRPMAPAAMHLPSSRKMEANCRA